MKLYNSLTRKIETFTPLNKKKITMYVCGITPYDTTHLGHAFTYVFFDSLRRFLTYRGYDVNYTQNVTDIDDDILKRAKKEKRDWKELGTYWTDKFLTDMSTLNVMPPAHYVRATDSIAMMIRIIAVLQKKKLAYESDGNIYFDVSKKADYGKLSGFSARQMELISAERGGDTKDARKKNPLYFILWQLSKEDEPFWNSPWGKGRPGWHIECSAMVREFLGEQVDIHGGGRDLIYPHHESEIAQSESFTGKIPFASYWLHTAMVMYQGEKMSKSLGNLVMVSDLTIKYQPQVIRYVLLSHHYRNPWEFHPEMLQEAREQLLLLSSFTAASTDNPDSKQNKYVQKFITFLEDDLSFERALSYLVTLTKTEKSKKAKEAVGFCLTLVGISL